MKDNEIDIKIKQFFELEILPTFNESAHSGLRNMLHKNIFEIKNIVKVVSTNEDISQPKIMDFGCGLGLNLMILSGLFQYECYGIDRGEEFSNEHNREVGNISQLETRLNKFGVIFIKQDPTISFIKDLKVDIVTSFDVIEHFSFSPKVYLANMLNSLNKKGFLLIGTPNQAHVFNRVKLLFGENIWEDFEYWYNNKVFYGHVRELTTNELRSIPESLELSNIKMYSSSYPLIYRLRSFILYKLLNSIFSIFNLNYYNLVIAQKLK